MTNIVRRYRAFKPLGLDLGTSKVALKYCGSTHMASEPFVVSSRRDSQRGGKSKDHFGGTARQMIGRAPETINVVRPIVGGVVADMSAASRFLRHFIRTHAPTLRWSNPTVACAVPWDSSNFDMEMIEECLSGAGVLRCRIISAHMAALAGWNPSFARRPGILALDIGAGTTEIAVVSFGRTIAARTLRCAGEAMTLAIVAHFLRDHGFLIGEASAEATKIRLGNVWTDDAEGKATIALNGKCRPHGVPAVREFSRAELAKALDAPLERIVEAVRSVLCEVPADVYTSVFDGPAALSGGGAMIKGLDRVLATRLGVEIQLVEDPQFCVLRGLVRIAAGELEVEPFLPRPPAALTLSEICKISTSNCLSGGISRGRQTAV